VIVHAAFGATLALLVASAAVARPTYVAFDKKNVVAQGRGDGTVKAIGGIDWWVSGEPARSFQRIGTIRDIRVDNGRPDGVIGASDIAKLVVAKGGDAVVVLAQTKTKVTAPSTFNLISGQIYGPSVILGPPLDAFDTTFAVISYVGQ
jgi:hypothetical protein